MPGVEVPEDRTLMQPVVGYCSNRECREPGKQRFEFVVENDGFACPKCGANSEPLVGVLVLTHLLVAHPQGPVIGQGGKRYVIACDDKRAYLATVSNLEAATGDPKIANCPGCLSKAETLNVIKKRVFIVPGKPKTNKAD